jgi:hypothetical protein
MSSDPGQVLQAKSPKFTRFRGGICFSRGAKLLFASIAKQLKRPRRYI